MEPQHFLNFFALPQGHGAFRPTLVARAGEPDLGEPDGCALSAPASRRQTDSAVALRVRSPAALSGAALLARGHRQPVPGAATCSRLVPCAAVSGPGPRTRGLHPAGPFPGAGRAAGWRGPSTWAVTPPRPSWPTGSGRRVVTVPSRYGGLTPRASSPSSRSLLASIRSIVPGAGCRRPAPGQPTPGPAGRRIGPVRRARRRAGFHQRGTRSLPGRCAPIHRGTLEPGDASPERAAPAALDRRVLRWVTAGTGGAGREHRCPSALAISPSSRDDPRHNEKVGHHEGRRLTR